MCVFMCPKDKIFEILIIINFCVAKIPSKIYVPHKYIIHVVCK